jgi:hypothetical protein
VIRRLLCLLLVAAPLAAAAPSPPGPADSLLVGARTDHYAGREERAIPVFESYLQSHPEDESVRLDLANALAWSGRPDDAIPLYRGLIEGGATSPALLRAHADCLRWAGRIEESLDAYRLLPERPEEPEVRREIQRLRLSVDPAGEAASTFFHDSGKITAQRHVAEGRLLGGSARNLGLAVGAERIEGAGASGNPTTSWGSTMTLRAGRTLGADRSIRLDAGVIAYENGPTHPRAELRLRAPLARNLPAEFRIAFRDRAFDLRSLRAYAKRIDGVDASAATYAALGYAGGLFARLRAGRYGDGNRFGNVDASADAAVGAGLRIAAAGSAIEHSRESDAYYAGRREWSAAAHLILDRTLAASARLRADAWLGRIGNIHGAGETRGGRLAFALPLSQAFWIRIDAETVRSRQSAIYTSRMSTLAVEWRP